MTVDMILAFRAATTAAAEQDGGPFPSTDPTQPQLSSSALGRHSNNNALLSCCIARRGSSSSVYAARE